MFFFLIFQFTTFLGLYFLFPAKFLKKMLPVTLFLSVIVFIQPAFSVWCLYVFGIILLWFYYSERLNLFISSLMINLLFSLICALYFIFYDILHFLGWQNMILNSFLLFLSAFLIFTGLKRLDKKHTLTNSLYHYSKDHHFIAVLINIFWFLINILLNKFETRSVNYLFISGIILLFWALCFTLLFFVIYIRIKEEKLSHYRKLYEVNQDYYNDLEEFRHDYKGLLFSLQASLETKNFEQGQEYLNSLRSYSQKLLGVQLDFELEKIQLLPLKGLLIEAINNASQNFHLTVKLKIYESITDINLATLDLVRVLSILLNNAIDHNRPENGLIDIAIRKSNTGIAFTISNTITSKVIDLNNILKRGYSQKKGNTGLGLSNLTKILNHYQQVSYSFDVDKENQLFHAYLFIASE